MVSFCPSASLCTRISECHSRSATLQLPRGLRYRLRCDRGRPPLSRVHPDHSWGRDRSAVSFGGSAWNDAVSERACAFAIDGGLSNARVLAGAARTCRLPGLLERAPSGVVRRSQHCFALPDWEMRGVCGHSNSPDRRCRCRAAVPLVSLQVYNTQLVINGDGTIQGK